MKYIIFLFTFLVISFTTSDGISAAAQENIFNNMAPSQKGRPLNHTFFHRDKANAPVFLQVVESGGPRAINFQVRLYPDNPEHFPEKPTKDAIEKHKQLIDETFIWFIFFS